MSESVERLLVRIDATTESLRRELKKADTAVVASQNRMQKSLAAMGKGWAGADKWVQKHNTQLKYFGAAAAGSVALATRAVAGYSDTYKNLQGQLKLVTTDQNQLNSVWGSALQIANDTGSSLDATITLYARMARATEELGTTQSQLLGITETVNKAYVVSGATATEASAATIQLSQAMAKGRLDGQELNAVLEQAPRLARLIADEMDAPIGALKDLGSQGKITSEVMVSAFENGGAAIAREFEQMPLTVERSMNQVQNNLLSALGKTDLSPLIVEIQKLSDIVSDPEFAEGLAGIAAGIVNITATSLELAASLPGMLNYLDSLVGLGKVSDNQAYIDIANSIASISDEIERMESAGFREFFIGPKREELEALQAEYAELTTKILGTSSAGAVAIKSFQESAAASALYKDALSGIIPPQEQFSGVLKESGNAQKAYQGILRNTNSDRAAEAKGVKKQSKALTDYIDDLEFQVKIMGESAREQKILTKIREKGAEGDKVAAAQIREMEGALWDNNEATKAQKEAVDELVDSLEELSDRHDKANQSLTDGIDEIDAIYRATEDYIGSIEDQVDALGKSERQQFIDNALRREGSRATEEQRQRIIALSGSLYDQREAIAASQAMWAETKSTLSDFFFEFAQDGESAFDTLADGFEAMLNKMIADAAAAEIFNLIGIGDGSGGFGDLLGQFTGGGSTGSSANPLSLIGGVKSLYGYGQSAYAGYQSGGIGGAYSSLFGSTPAVGTAGSTIAGPPVAGSAAAPTSGAGAGALSLAAYAAIAYGAYESYGDISGGKYDFQDVASSEWFRTKYGELGGFTDAFEPLLQGLTGNPGGVLSDTFVFDNPITQGINSLLGGGNSHDRVYQDLDFTKSQQDDSFVTDSGRHSDSKQTVDSITDALEQFADSIGGSEFAGQFNISRQTGLAFEGENYKDSSQFITKIFDEIVLGSSVLDQKTKDLITSFDDLRAADSGQMSAFAATVAQSSIAAGGLSESIIELITGFQGSADDAVILSQALLSVTPASTELSDRAVEMALAFSGSGQELHDYTQAIALIDVATSSASERAKELALGFDGSAAEMVAYADTLVMIDEVTGDMSESLRDVIFGFEGTNEELAKFAVASAQIHDLTNFDTVTDAISQFNAVQPSLLDSYNTQTQSLNKLVTGYDGSLASTEALAGALTENRALAFEFATAIQEIGQQLGLASESQARYFRESVMSAEALRDARLAERDSLRGAFDNLLDPEEITETFDRIKDLNRQIFDSLAPEDQTAQTAEEFASFIEDLNASAQESFGGMLGDIRQAEADVNLQIASRMEAIATQDQATADMNRETAQMNQSAAQSMINTLNTTDIANTIADALADALAGRETTT